MDDDISFRALRKTDLELLLSTPAGLFDHPVDPAQAAAFLADPGHLLILAFAGEDAVGFVSGTVLRHPDKPPSLFVNEVGVREAWQRRGIARRLMQQMMAMGRANGCEGLWLGTEPDNIAALALYRSLRGDEVPFIGFGWDGAFDA